MLLPPLKHMLEDVTVLLVLPVSKARKSANLWSQSLSD